MLRERPLLEVQDAGRAFRRVRIVRHHDDRLLVLAIQALQQRQHFRARLRVEVARRLVREQERRIGHDRARDRHALLLSARQLPGIVAGAVGEPHDAEGGHHVVAALLLREAREQQRQLDVLERRQHGNEVVQLEDEPDVPRAPRRERAFRQPADLGVRRP